MEKEISQLVNEFAGGRLTRRQLMSKLGALFAIFAGSPFLSAGRASTQQERVVGTFEATELNHIALRVTNVPRSRDFYIKHLGLTVARESATDCFLTCGSNFVALFQGSEPGMHHYCYSVKNFDVNVASKKLKAEGLNPRVGGSERIYFEDPDGLTVQLADENHMP